MAGIKALKRYQLGAETTPGTAVAATTRWRGPAPGFTPDSPIERVEEDVAYLSPVIRTYKPYEGVTIPFPQTPATFEQLPYVLEAAIDAATPAQDGTGSGYVYEYALPTTSKPTVRTYTIEAGDDQAAEEAEYCFVETFTLSGQTRQAVMMESTWRGRQITAGGAFTAGLQLPTVENILFANTKLYVDDSAGVVGTTQLSGLLLSWQLQIQTGIVAKWTGDGSLAFNHLEYTMPQVSLTLRMLHTADLVAEVAKARAEEIRLIRLDIEGRKLATSDSFSNKLLRIDLAGTWEQPGALDDDDGSSVREMQLIAGASIADNLFAKLTVVNELTSLP